MLSCDELPFIVEYFNPIEAHEESVPPTAVNDECEPKSLGKLRRIILKTHSFWQFDGFFVLLNELFFDRFLIIPCGRAMKVL